MPDVWCVTYMLCVCGGYRGEKGYMRLRRYTDPEGDALYAPGLCGVNINPSLPTGGYIMTDTGTDTDTESASASASGGGTEWLDAQCSGSSLSPYEQVMTATDWARVHWGYSLLLLLVAIVCFRIITSCLERMCRPCFSQSSNPATAGLPIEITRETSGQTDTKPMNNQSAADDQQDEENTIPTVSYSSYQNGEVESLLHCQNSAVGSDV